MKTKVLKYNLAGRSQVFVVSLLALLRKTGLAGEETSGAIPAEVLDTLKIQLVSPNVTGAQILTTKLTRPCHYSVEGNELTIALGELNPGQHRLTVKSVYGTNTRSLLIIDVTVPVGDGETSEAINIDVAAVSSITPNDSEIVEDVETLKGEMLEAQGAIEALQEDMTQKASKEELQEAISESLEEVQEAIEQLPDGQAVSAQVALNTIAIEGLKNGLNQSVPVDVLFGTVLRNGTALNSGNANCVANKFCIPFGEFDRVTIYTDRPNGANKVYRYGYGLYYEPQLLSNVSSNRHSAKDATFADDSNIIERTDYRDKAFAVTIAEFDLTTEQVQTLRIGDFYGYNVWFKFERSSKANVDNLADSINYIPSDVHTFTQVSDFVNGNIQSTGTVTSGTGKTSPEWMRVRKGNVLRFTYPSTVTYDGTEYQLRIRVVLNAHPKAGTTPSKTKTYDNSGQTFDVSINEDLYHYFKFTLFLYLNGSMVSDTTLAETIWASLSSLNVSVEIAGGVSTGYYPLDEMDARLQELEGADGIGTNIVKLNDISLTKQRFTQIKRTVRGSISVNQPNLILAHFSDIHQDRRNLERILEYCTYWGANLNDIICTGDLVQNSFNETSQDVWNAFWADAQKILIVIGNHDTAHYANGTYDWTHYIGEQAYVRYIAPNVDNWGVTQPQNAEANGYCYYYKDYTSQKTRLVVLDVMGWDATQLSWFVAVLASAITAELSVVVAIHYSASMEYENCSFNSLTPSGFYDHIPNDAMNAIDDFITGGGEFVCWLSGHTHRDYFGVATGHPNQLVVTISTAQCQREGNQEDNVERVVGTRTEDLFNIVSIDTYQKYITMFRVGADLDMMLRHIGTISYDYANKKMVWND